MLRFPTTYVVKPGDDLGSASYWNLRLQDLDLRINAVESFTSDINEAAQQVIDAGISRIDNTFQPALNALINQLGDLSVDVANLQSTVLTDQGSLTTQLEDLVTTAESLVASLESLGIVEGGTF